MISVTVAANGRSRRYVGAHLKVSFFVLQNYSQKVRLLKTSVTQFLRLTYSPLACSLGLLLFLSVPLFYLQHLASFCHTQAIIYSFRIDSFEGNLTFLN